MKSVLKFTILALLGLSMSGCMAKSAYYSDNKDEIEIIIDGIDAHDINGVNPYSITKEGNTVCVLEFIDAHEYNVRKKIAKNNNAYIITEIENDIDKGVSYMLYRDDNYDYNYLMKLNNSKYTMILTSKYGKDKAKDCYNKLNFITKK